MSKLALYFHTIRHLRPIQIAGRIRRRVQRRSIAVRATPPQRARSGTYVAPIAAVPSLVAPDVFRFLEVERRCAAADWAPADASKLWVYNLHYFDDLNARGAAERAVAHAALVARWVRENPIGEGVGWEPYPVSRRIVNWIKWASRGNALPAEAVASLATQARWLASRIEYHLLGNHLFANAKALVHAGLYFDGRDADRWLAAGTVLLDREVGEQVLADGGHFELSPMYHASILEDVLDLVNAQRAYGRAAPSRWLDAIARMTRWLSALTHPDGEIAFFNDAAFGVAPSAAELAAYARRLALPIAPFADDPLTVLAASGYVRAAAGPARLLCDCAAVGPDYIPGHAHADTLSFELTLGEQRVFVNSGTSEYGTGPERERQRGTAAHNTVVVDGADSSEVWAGFRVARRAHARLLSAAIEQGVVHISASHDGYRRLPGRNEHRRRWTLDRGSLRVDDEITGRARSAVACFHLHPGIEARMSGVGTVRLHVAGRGDVDVSVTGASDVQVQASTWHPRFGQVVPNRKIVAQLAGAALSTRVSWT